MEKLFVSYEIALKLKEKGFDEPFKPFDSTFYYTNGRFSSCNDGYKNGFFQMDIKKEFVLAPLYQQIIDWFREKHDLMITVSSWNVGTFCWTIKKVKGDIYSVSNNCIQQGSFKQYYEALNQAIEKALILI